MVFGPPVWGLGGKLYVALVDVFLANADPVEPDLLILLPDNRHLVSKRGIEGPPDWIVEVLSPSNHHHDQVTKRALYALAGSLRHHTTHLGSAPDTHRNDGRDLRLS